MKLKKIIIMAVVAAATVSGAQAQDKKEAAKGIAEVTFNVSTMHGDHCKKRIENTVAFEKGVTDLKVNLADNQVWIKYNTKKTDKEKLQKAFEKLGYTAEEAEPKTKEEEKYITLQ
ncbi:MAG: cation transporter [Prevotellaceae bacterium]|jgi:copper chaperone CopZ|nr:cation transporter [Prevotellaceae bacterium]